MADTDLMGSQDPMQQQMVGTPPPFMQGGISPMMMGAPPQAGGVLPPTNPVDAAQQQAPQPPQDPMQQAMLSSLQTGTQGMQQREQAAMGPEMGGRLPGMMQRREELSGQQSFHPNFQQGQGAGGFFHNLGQALIALGAATRPGQAVDAVVHSKQREEYAGLSDQIKSLQKQQELTQAPEAALAGMGPKYMSAEARASQADTAAKREQDYKQHIQDQAKQWAQSIDLRKAGLDEKSRHDFATEIQQKANEMGRDYRANNKNATEVEVAGIITNAKESLANEAALRDPSIAGWLKNMVGIETPQIQAAPSPTMGGPAAKSKAPSSPEASAAARSPKAGVSRFKEGDTVIIHGKQVKIGKIHPDGTFDPAP